MQIAVECQKRPEGSKPRALRREGFIPAALYGHKGAESISLTLKAKDAQTLLKKASVNNTLVDLNIPDVPWNGKALIREVQAHPWKRTLYHLSFFSVASQDSLEVVVPLKFVGNSIGVKQGGIMEQMLTEVKVQCAPDNIRESIDIDISNMALGSSLHVSELVLPEGITVLDDPDRNILSIVAPAKMAETTGVEEAEAETSA
ncbi:MAG: 50S ribosomal protein L25/general stress protein Ctc [Moorea sp. SIO2B7]|nr:50S ribosomal protein L25/general stress protein Ctc [Moorena sp. SIO2B7]